MYGTLGRADRKQLRCNTFIKITIVDASLTYYVYYATRRGFLLKYCSRACVAHVYVIILLNYYGGAAAANKSAIIHKVENSDGPRDGKLSKYSKP